MQKKFRASKKLNDLIKHKCKNESETFQNYITNLIKRDLGINGTANMSLFSQNKHSKLSQLVNQLGNHQSLKALQTRLKLLKSVKNRKASGKYKGRKYSLSVDNLHPTLLNKAIDAYMNRSKNGMTVAEICRAYKLTPSTFYRNMKHYKHNGKLKYYQSELKTKRN